MQLNDLLGKSRNELDAMFGTNLAGPIPEGNSEGDAIALAGSFWNRLIAHFVHDLAWQGKVFTRNPDGTTTLLNKLGPDGARAIMAQVYYTESWVDGKKCIVLDYSKTALARKIRDEIRLVDPVNRIYLGIVWWGKKRTIDFALKFPA
jgi:hypothetical protein